MGSLQRLDAINKPDSFDDQKTPQEIAASEASSLDLGDFFEAVLSQIKRIIHKDSAGKWYDDPAESPGGGNLDALLVTTDGGVIYDNSGVIVVKEAI